MKNQSQEITKPLFRLPKNLDKINAIAIGEKTKIAIRF